MRATWITSLLAGSLLGFLSRVVDLADEDGLPWTLTKQEASWALMLVFFVTTFVGVIGIPQLRESYAEMKRRGAWTLNRREDLAVFYFPAWGRMAMWFVAVVLTSITAKAVGW